MNANSHELFREYLILIEIDFGVIFSIRKLPCELLENRELNYSILFQILLSADGVGEEFEEVDVDRPHPIIADMHLSPRGDFIYAASPYKVSFPLRWSTNKYPTADKQTDERTDKQIDSNEDTSLGASAEA